MGESKASATDDLTTVRDALGQLINVSYALKYYLLKTEQLDKANAGPPPITGIFEPPQGMWYEIARWWNAYTKSLASIDSIQPLLDARWGNSRLWLDEAKGSIYHLGVHFQPGQYLRPAEIQALESAFAVINDVDVQNLALNERWLKEHDAAIERTTADGFPTGTVNDVQWNQIQNEIDQSREAVTVKLTAAANSLKGHRYIVRFLSFVRNPSWKHDFDVMVWEIESRAAVLLSISSKPPVPLKLPTASFVPSAIDSVVVLDRKTSSAIVNGNIKKLSSLRFKIIDALIAAGEAGLTLASVKKISGDAPGVIRRMREKDEDWNQMIQTAESYGGRFLIRNRT
jgi:hypothetical protein